MEGEKALSAESKIVPGLGVKFIPVVSGRLQRRFTRHTISSIFRIPFSFLQSFGLLLKIKPDAILSFGGYVSVPIVISGWFLRIPVLTHEQTVVFGLSSRINSFFAKKIAVSFPQSLAFFPKNKAILTGNPIRKEIFEVNKSLIIQSSNLPIIYVTGGNQGAHAINMAVMEILPKLLEKYIVVHQCGDRDYEFLNQQSAALRLHSGQVNDQQLMKNYFLTPYIGPGDIGWVLNKADLIISRSGANTVCELAALGKPSILIPIPWTYQDEQTKNAQMLKSAGIAEILPQDELSSQTLLSKINEMFKNLKDYQKHKEDAKKLVNLDASEKIAEEINNL